MTFSIKTPRTAGKRATAIVCYAPAFALVAVLVFFRIWTAASPLWHDETLNVISVWGIYGFGSMKHLWDIFGYNRDNNHLLMSAYFWAIGPGHSYFVFRLPSFVAGLVILPLGYWAFRRICGKQAAIIFGLLTLASSDFMQLASEARGYLLAAVFVVAAFGCCERMLEKPSRRWALGFWAASIAAILAHLSGVIVYGALAIWSGSLFFRQALKNGIRREAALILALAIAAAATLIADVILFNSQGELGIAPTFNGIYNHAWIIDALWVVGAAGVLGLAIFTFVFHRTLRKATKLSPLEIVILMNLPIIWAGLLLFHLFYQKLLVYCWAYRMSPADFASDFMTGVFNAPAIPIVEAAVALVIVILALIGLVHIARRSSAWIFFVILTVLAAAMIASEIHRTIVQPRYVFVAIVFLLLLVARGLAVIAEWQPAGKFLSYAIIAIFMISAVPKSLAMLPQGTGYAEAVRSIGNHSVSFDDANVTDPTIFCFYAANEGTHPIFSDDPFAKPQPRCPDFFIIPAPEAVDSFSLTSKMEVSTPDTIERNGERFSLFEVFPGGGKCWPWALYKR